MEDQTSFFIQLGAIMYILAAAGPSFLGHLLVIIGAFLTTIFVKKIWKKLVRQNG